jgi:putative transposase
MIAFTKGGKSHHFSPKYRFFLLTTKRRIMMAKYDIKLNSEEVVGLLAENDKFSTLVESIINQVLEAQMTEHIGVEYYQHSDNRSGYRNGYRLRKIATRVGKLVLRVPQTRDGSFSTDLFRRYQRNEQAFVLALMEMYLQGVSTRKVTKITEELCGVSFSKSTVSQLATELDTRVNAFRTRKLDNSTYPFLIVDALFVDVHNNNAVQSMAVLIAYGINGNGTREVLGLWLADSESETSWDNVFKELKARGLKSVEFVISDNHTGLVRALKKNFHNAIWQRCQVHFMRNILGLTAKKHRSIVAEKLKLIFAATDKKTARMLAKQLIEEFNDKASDAMSCLENGLESALNILVLPCHYHKKLRTTNLAERVNEEIRRRQRVIRIFPNVQATIRLIGAIVADINNNWITGKKYLCMDDFWDWKQNNTLELENNNVLQF